MSPGGVEDQHDVVVLAVDSRPWQAGHDGRFSPFRVGGIEVRRLDEMREMVVERILIVLIVVIEQPGRAPVRADDVPEYEVLHWDHV